MDIPADILYFGRIHKVMIINMIYYINFALLSLILCATGRAQEMTFSNFSELLTQSRLNYSKQFVGLEGFAKSISEDHYDYNRGEKVNIFTKLFEKKVDFDGFGLYSNVCTKNSTKSDISEWLVAINPKYAFALARSMPPGRDFNHAPKGDAQWKLDRFEMAADKPITSTKGYRFPINLELPEKGDPKELPCFRIACIANNYFTPSTDLAGKDVEIKKITATNKDIEIMFSIKIGLYKYGDGGQNVPQKEVPVNSVLVLDKENFLLPVSLVQDVSVFGESHRFVAKKVFSYKAKSRMPIRVESTDRWTVQDGAKVLMDGGVDSTETWDYERQKIPNFILSTYGFPEPEGVVWGKPTPLYVWLLSGAAAFALFALLCRWALRRRTPPSAG